mmetsp:Transcript_96885/g.153430  ORF Transcript_96885/g.153430 Transcript_96885/m.153430 type:complete len:344 (-) Transcript_96885:576-1607(-)
MMIGQIGRIGLHHLVAMKDCRGVKMSGVIGLFHLDLMTSHSEAMPIGGIGLLHLDVMIDRRVVKKIARTVLLHLDLLSDHRDVTEIGRTGLHHLAVMSDLLAALFGRHRLAVIIDRHAEMTHHHVTKIAKMDGLLDVRIEEMSGRLHIGSGLLDARIGKMSGRLHPGSDRLAKMFEGMTGHLDVSCDRHDVKAVAKIKMGGRRIVMMIEETRGRLAATIEKKASRLVVVVTGEMSDRLVGMIVEMPVPLAATTIEKMRDRRGEMTVEMTARPLDGKKNHRAEMREIDHVSHCRGGQEKHRREDDHRTRKDDLFQGCVGHSPWVAGLMLDKLHAHSRRNDARHL